MGLSKEPSIYDKQLTSLGRTLQALREGQGLNTLIEIALNYFSSEFGFDLIWVGVYERSEHQLIGMGGITPTPDAQLLRQRFALNPGDVLEQVVVQQIPMVMTDLREEARMESWRKIAQQHNIQGTVVFPIRHRDRCLGVLIVGSKQWGAAPRSDTKRRLLIVLGELGAALEQQELAQQQQQTKQPDEPLLNLMGKLRTLQSLSQRLQAVAAETQRFVAPSRTYIYWFDPEQQIFQCQVILPPKGTTAGDAQPAPDAIAAPEFSSFYQALAADQLVAVNEMQMSLKVDAVQRFMQKNRAKSMIAAPILFQNELKGFLSVEGNQPRLWQDPEKRFVRGAAHLVALTAPLHEMETTIRQIKTDQLLTTSITRAIVNDDDWQTTLKTAAEDVRRHLNVDRFLLLQWDADQGKFTIQHQSAPANARTLVGTLPAPERSDWQTLEQSSTPTAIENWSTDTKLLGWRDQCAKLGMRSLLACSTTPGRPLEGLLLLAHDKSRTWTKVEQEIVRVVSQQLGLVIHQWQLQHQTDQHQRMTQTLQWGLTTLQQIQEIDHLEKSAMQLIAQVMQAPLAALVTWFPGRQVGNLAATVCADEKQAPKPDTSVSIHSDPLIRQTLANDGLLTLTAQDLDANTRQWLAITSTAQVLAIALRTAPEHEPCGVVIVADHAERFWAERHLHALGTIVSQLSWSRRYLLLTQMLSNQREELERLNWYKILRLEELYRVAVTTIRKLNDLFGEKSEATPQPTTPPLLQQHRYRDAIRQLSTTLGTIAPVIQKEQWRLQPQTDTILLSTLLRRSLERVDHLIQLRQLWSQIHNLPDASSRELSALSIQGDTAKIEQVVYELMATACRRSQPKGRIDIWPRLLDAGWLELSITDNGTLEPRLLEDLETGRSVDLLAPSLLNYLPGLHLLICRSLIQQSKGELTIHKLEDGRILSRLVLPLAEIIP